jgi:transcriptional regulator of arginine metabolism
VDDPDLHRIAQALIGVETAGDALVVLRTPPGEASPVGAALDRLSWAGVVGTLAGDDTIFVAVRDAAAQRAVLRELRKAAGLR